MKLAPLLEQMLSENDLDRVTARQYSRSLERFEEMLGRPAETDDLTAPNVNKYLMWLAETHNSSGVTQRNYRRGICRIWNYASEVAGHPSYNPKRLRQPKVEMSPVHAWSRDDREIILAAAKRLIGTLRCGIPAALFMELLIRVAFDTGLRPSDLRRLKWEQVDFEKNTISVIQSKTGNPHTPRFSPATRELLKSMQAYRQDRIFPLNKWGTYRWEKILLAEAQAEGLNKRHRQGLGNLRSSHATAIYKEHGLSAAAESLGHVGGPRTVSKHYIDSSEIRKGYLPGEADDRSDRDYTRRRA